jgi:hypothetical protein
MNDDNGTAKGSVVTALTAGWNNITGSINADGIIMQL